MKSKEECKQSWETLSTAPEFEDCLKDLLRFTKFFKPMTGLEVSNPEYIGSAYQRAVLTYILKQTGYPRIDVDMTPNTK